MEAGEVIVKPHELRVVDLQRSPLDGLRALQQRVFLIGIAAGVAVWLIRQHQIYNGRLVVFINLTHRGGWA